MRKLFLLVPAAGAILGLGGFVAQQTIGYDPATGSVCAFDRSSTPQCVPLGRLDPLTHAWSPTIGGKEVSAVTGSGAAVLAVSPTLTGAIAVDGSIGTTAKLTGDHADQYIVNNNYIGSDTASCAGSFCVFEAWQHSFGGSSVRGGRATTYSLLNQTAPTASASPNRNYVANVAIAQTSSGDGGTGLSDTTAKGAYFGIAPEGILKTGSTNVFNVTAAEFDVLAEAGTSVLYKTVAQFGAKSGDAVRGSGVDTILWFADQLSTIHHRHGILFGSPSPHQTYPIATEGTMIGSVNHGRAPRVRHGVDFSGVDFGGCAFKSPSFCVDGAGGVTSAHVVAEGAEPSFTLTDRRGAATWRAIAAGGALSLQTLDDARHVATDAYVITGGTNGPRAHTWSTGTTAGSPVARMRLDADGLTVTPPVRATSVFVGSGFVPIAGSLFQAHLATDVNLLFAGGSDTARLRAANDTDSAKTPMRIEASSLDIDAETLKVGGVKGVSCPAGTVDLSTLVVTNGIVTHC